MSDPGNTNPYKSPTAASDPPPKKEENESKYSSVLWLFVVPFLLAHAIYWPLFIFGLSAFGVYGFYGLFMGTGAVLIGGAVYGVWLGIQINAANFNASLHPALYGLGETLWFLFSLVAPCGAIAISMGM